MPSVSPRGRRAAAGAEATVVLADDGAVQRLNARHRGRNKPTNVLDLRAADAGDRGRDRAGARRGAAGGGGGAAPRPAHHLAHLVVHGALHLRGHDHARAGEARRMEMAEARILRRLGVPNPWKRA